jgi:hypothetical protein
MSNSRITYAPHPGTTAETEADALALVFRFVLFETSVSKKDRSPNSGPHDTRGESENGSRTRSILPP